MATECHRRLVHTLMQLGYEVHEEEEFYPKRVDCYLPELHVAFEADGIPWHKSPTKDRDRDDYLMATFALPVFRIPEDLLLRDKMVLLRYMIDEILTKTWGMSVIERRMAAYKAGAIQDG